MSKFSKGHYEAIAQALQDAKLYEDLEGERGVTVAIQDLGRMFARDNAAFQYDRFVAACEPGANVKARS